MKTTIQFLSLLLCFELIIGPVQGSLLLPQAAMAQEKPCPAGQEFNSAAGRCNTKADVLRVNNKVNACGDDKECLKRNAEAELDAKEVEKNRASDDEKAKGMVSKNDSFFKEDGTQKGIVKAGNAAAVGIPALIAINTLINRQKIDKDKRSSFRCKPASLMLMYSAAAALAVGEVYGYFNHKARLDRIQEDWDKTVMPKADESTDKQKTDATEAQSEAFEFLARNEDEIAKTAKTKKGFYIAATGLFAAGALAATLEQFQLKKAQLDITSVGPGKMAAGAAQVPPNAMMIEQGRKLIADGKATVNRLTCSTGNDEMDQEAADKVKNAEAANDKAKKTAADNAARDERIKNYKTERSGLNQEIIKKQDQLKTVSDPEMKAELENEIKDLKEQRTVLENQNKNDLQNKREEAIKKELSKPVDKAYQCVPPKVQGPNGCVDPTMSKFDPWKTTPLPDVLNEVIRARAISNFTTARNAFDLVELFKEYESIQFENYSKLTYSEEEEKALKNIEIPSLVSQFIAASFMPQAHAGEGGGLLGKVGAAVPLLLGVKQVLGGVKFKGGQPIDPSHLAHIKEKVNNDVSKAIGKPTTRIAINGVLGGWMGVMSVHMKQQQKVSEERAAKLRSMKEDFKSANGIMNCTEEDRNDQAKPRCYCYTSDNKYNQSRASSSVCKQEYKGLTAIKKLESNPKVCVNQGMAMDPSCACRANNSCLKTTRTFSMKGFNPGTFKMISAGAAPADDLFSGISGGGDIADSASFNAARIREAADDMLAKVDPKAAKQKDKMEKDLEKALLATAGGLSMGASQGGGSMAIPSSPAAAAAALDKELKENKEKELDINTAGAKAQGGQGFESLEDEQMPEFSMGGEDANSEEIEIAEVMSQEVDFGGNADINKGSDTNLFEVLSNRYQRSAMRRLFEDQVDHKADKPAKTDIVE